MISATAEYALRAIVYLAQHVGESKTTQEIAEGTRVPPGYLSKIMQALVRRDLVTSQRGLGGGFSLAVDPESVTIYDVFHAVDSPPQRIKECPLGLKGHINLCPVHSVVDEAMAGVERTFRANTIGHLLEIAKTSKPLCEVAEKINAVAAAGRPAPNGLAAAAAAARPKAR